MIYKLINKIKNKFFNIIFKNQEFNKALYDLKLTSLKIPKKKILIIFGYNHQYYFSGASKMLSIKLKKFKNFEFYYLTTRIDIYDLMQKNNIPSLLWDANNIKKNEMDILLQSKVVISEFDFSEMETCKILYSLLYGAKKIQVWHGRAFGYLNKINKSLNRKFFTSSRTFYRYLDRKTYFALLSPMLENEHKSLEIQDYNFEYKKELGNCKLDLVKKNHTDDELINVDINTYNYVKKSKKIKILICPSSPRIIHGDFKGINDSYNYLPKIDLDIIDKMLENSNIEIFIKYHMIDTNHTKSKNYKNVRIINSDNDIYPLLYYFDFFVTNHSTIMYDFLFLKKPIIIAMDINKFTELDPAKRFVNFNKFMETFYNCRTLNNFYKFIKNPEIIQKEKMLYQKKIDELNYKINKFSLNQNSVDEYISEISKILNVD